ncbi:putative diphosphomevalonate decarboxylase [Oesophagostomum dentatum]|uniref:Putative diphosphomevalonate decarboxylase n=1 Tax=Oesophagostomum dentatum TaxID=61180 RepID=A0A0B1SQX3_OESDE|nr:putative diphosphomevalonate decarboxylase [Oesophagostomum dentatum]
MVVYPEDLGSVEVEVPINIALIKYWGKRDEELILPVNSSVSLNIDALVARTRVSCSMSITDSVKINDTVVDLEKNKRFRRCFDGQAARVVVFLADWWSGVQEVKNPVSIVLVNLHLQQVLPEEFWPELRAVIVVLDEAEKEVGSSIGMRRSMETSELLKHRAHAVVPERIKRITLALKERNFDEFARITMADSNQLHAVCLDTFPPLKVSPLFIASTCAL